MNTLREMGIQQWRLRSSNSKTDADTGVWFNESESTQVEETQPVKASTDNSPNLNDRVQQSTSQVLSQREREDVADEASTAIKNQPSVNASSTETDAPRSVSADEDVPVVHEVRLAPVSKPPVATTTGSASAVNVTQSSTQGNSLSSLNWDALQAMIETNQSCPSCWKDKSILGSGSTQADWMFVTDAPSLNDISAQQIFTGRAGLLFEAMLGALGLERGAVYTTSVFKCAPPADLSMSPACNNLLQRQVELLAPKVIITFGEFSSQSMLRANESLDVLRGKEQYSLYSEAIVLPTFSPAQMLDDSTLKAQVWVDLKKGLHAITSRR